MKKFGMLLLLCVAVAFVVTAGISTAEKETKEK